MNKRNLLRTPLIIAVILLFSLTTFVCCEKKETVPEPEAANYYSELARNVSTGLNKIGQSLREQGATFSSHDKVWSIARQYYSDSPDAYKAFVTGYENSLYSGNRKSSIGNEIIEDVLSEIESSLINCNTSEEFREYLQAKFNKISEEDMGPESKDYLLKYIITYKVSVKFIAENLDLLTDTSGQLKSTQNWWTSWGKCAAGIIGGAGIGALGGGAAGSAVPVVGTAAGLVVGGISGGLSGAAAAC